LNPRSRSPRIASRDHPTLDPDTGARRPSIDEYAWKAKRASDTRALPTWLNAHEISDFLVIRSASVNLDVS